MKLKNIKLNGYWLKGAGVGLLVVILEIIMFGLCLGGSQTPSYCSFYVSPSFLTELLFAPISGQLLTILIFTFLGGVYGSIKKRKD